jgi:beta-lactamase superfamily II metal-dependent hydrolase
MSDLIEFNVFGGCYKSQRFGESILIRSPKNRLGIIDSCIGGKISPLSYLEENYLGEHLDFFLLTHPHRDHYLGISDLLSFFWDKGLIAEQLSRYFSNPLPGDIPTTYEQFVTLIELLDLEIAGCFNDALASLGNERKAFWDLLAALKNKHQCWERVNVGEDLATEKFGVEVRALSPSKAYREQIDMALLESVASHLRLTTGEGKIKLKTKKNTVWGERASKVRRDINSLSVGARVSWNGFSGLLLSDMQEGAIKESMRRYESWYSKVQFVKIAHHGGAGSDFSFEDQNSFLDLLCERGGKVKVAVVTHFAHMLPKAKFLDRLKECFERVFVTSMPPDLERMGAPGRKENSTKRKPSGGLSFTRRHDSIITKLKLRGYDEEDLLKREGLVSLSFNSKGELEGEPICKGGAFEWGI